MNGIKNKAQNLLIIIIACFVIIPFINSFFHVLEHFNSEEGFTSPYVTTDGSTLSSNFKMDRIDVSGVAFPEGSTGASGEYLYCPGGTIKCEDDSQTLVEITDASYGLFGDTITGYTYENKCTTGSNAICSNYFSGIGEETYKYIDTNDAESTFKSVNTDPSFVGFIGPYSSKPLDISGEYMYLYNTTTGNVDISSSPCFLYESYDDCKANYFTEDSSTDDTSDKNTTEVDININEEIDIVNAESLKCTADNGSNIGDPLCCGQEGVVQTTEYNCPAEYPNCIGYKCGQSWGTCKA